MARRRSAVEREREVAEWRASGISAGAYAAQRGYSASSLRTWAADLRDTEPKFVRLELSPRLADIVVEIGEARVRVKPGFDASLLRGVVAALSKEAR